MAIISHKIFLIPINDGMIDESTDGLKKINQFLAKENIVYLNHSVTTVAKTQLKSVTNSTHPDYLEFANTDTFCVISIVYQDLTGTKHDVKQLSEKSKSIVKTTLPVNGGQKYPRPKIA